MSLDKSLTLFEAETVTEVARGLQFTEGPLWDPRGFFYFADVRASMLYKLTVGLSPHPVRSTRGGSGLTFDGQGCLVQCEGAARRVTRWCPETERLDVIADFAEGHRLNRPNDVVCSEDGTIYFSDPDKMLPVKDREVEAGVWRLRPEGGIEQIVKCEFPNGLAFSPDERRMYVANTRFQKYLHAVDFHENGEVSRQSIFADMSHGVGAGVPDGVKVDVEGNVYCTGPGGIWAFTPNGQHVATQPFPTTPANMAFGGQDMRTLLVCARESVYTVRMRVPGLSSAWQRRVVDRLKSGNSGAQ